MQITRDLAGFWKQGYLEVKKDIKRPLSEALLAGGPLLGAADTASAAALGARIRVTVPPQSLAGSGASGS